MCVKGLVPISNSLIQTCFSATSPHIMSQKRNALQEAIDRALRIPNNNSQSSENNQFLEEESVIMRKRPILGNRFLVPIRDKKPIQMRADEYYEKALASTYGVKRYEHLDDGLIMFTYSDFSITKIRELVGGSFKVELYQTTRCKNDPDTRGRTVADELNEKWAEQADKASNENYLKVLDRFKATCYNY